MASEGKHIVLSAEEVSIGYFSKKRTEIIASKLSFQCEEGELIALVGANGIGKSTLLRTLAGMQKPVGGKITLQGTPLAQVHPVQMATLLSVVLTETTASKNLTVGEFVSLGRQPHTNWMGQLTETDTQKIKQALLQTDILALVDRKCLTLSDGQLQRVAIARALAQDTPIIVLDEPTTHLDLFHRASVLKLLEKLTKEANKTILFSTHEIDLAIQLADKILMITSDHMVFGTPSQLIAEGHFDRLFPKELIEFDSKTGRFQIKK